MSTEPPRATTESSDSPIAKAWSSLLKPVFIPASLVILGLIAFAAVYGGTAEDAFSTLNSFIADGVGWWYILAATGFVVFALYCALSKIGRIRLGRDDEDPEFGLLSWFAMLFSAGMGIGLLFYGVAEPLMHYLSPPDAGQVEGATDAAANQALQLTMFHWGLHAWSIYVVVGLGLAYMTFRKGRPLAVRWLLEPLLGRERVEGWIGHAIDAVAIIGTLFGVATSLGFGVQQIMAGLEFLGWIESSNYWILGIVAVITLIATVSVVSGVHRGLKWLSNINMTLAAILALFVALAGATLFLLQAWVQNLGNYFQALPELMLRTAPFSEDGWAAAWTIFYWGWWISWAPFVGMFIARISRGRTIREFVAGVLIAPTLVSSLWFTIFGDSAILRQREVGDIAPEGSVNADTALFAHLDTLPLATITSVLAICVVVFFFVTSSDSGSLVVDILATGGAVETSKITRVYWAVLEGFAAAVLLVVGGSESLTALQTASIATAVPFSIIMVLACFSLLRAFRYDVSRMPTYVRVVQVSGESPAGGGISLPTEEAQPSAPLPPHVTKKPWRGVRGVSATFAGLSSWDKRDDRRDQTGLLVSVRAVPPGDVTVDPATGRVHTSTDAPDPLGGEVFDTPEFAASHEGSVLKAAEESGETAGESEKQEP
ncbi:BCCT family transporter [Hoyosella subflava]|uniref:Glycine betaine transport integral membrane protein BetP n=1 Tax=Hoyosella subflava (strain DSM 45089 / JCM 17490 / NBRC 109087 / DQS3-9A1) TaxID=443218 RepID=F6ER76_HOYSD|nr:BCCT family transporter [Hoyosella subflava]AEF41954.1 Glycine betaine transport integral membrane protein BetP [Hoyosella subflava DQS3-9A1]